MQTVDVDIVVVVQRVQPSVQPKSGKGVHQVGAVRGDDVANVERSPPLAVHGPAGQVADHVVGFWELVENLTLNFNHMNSNDLLCLHS